MVTVGPVMVIANSSHLVCLVLRWVSDRWSQPVTRDGRTPGSWCGYACDGAVGAIGFLTEQALKVCLGVEGVAECGGGVGP